MTIPKTTICLRYDRDAEAAATFCAATFPDNSVDAAHRALARAHAWAAVIRGGETLATIA